MYKTNPYIYFAAMFLALTAISETVFMQDMSGRPKRVAEVEKLDTSTSKKWKRSKSRVRA